MSNIKIPKQLYVGILSNKKSDLPRGFMTPYGTNAAAQKRMSNVDIQTKSGNIKPIVIENSPLVGFKLTSGIPITNYGGFDKWRIEDPRGFELEISSINLATLLSNSVIDKGEILDPCIWGRESANDVLISVESDNYKEAVKNTEIYEKTTSWKNAKPGNTVVLQNGTKGTYLGRYALYTNNGRFIIEKNPNAYHVVKSKNVFTPPIPGYEYDLEVFKTQKLSYIEDNNTEYTPQEAEELTNKLLSEKSYVKSNIFYNPVILAVWQPTESYAKLIPDYTIEFIEVDFDAYNESHKMIVELQDGSKWLYTNFNNGLYAIDEKVLPQIKQLNYNSISATPSDIKAAYYRTINITTPIGNDIKNSLD